MNSLIAETPTISLTKWTPKTKVVATGSAFLAINFCLLVVSVYDPLLALALFISQIALVFDFVNGFHDAANSIAPIVASGVLKDPSWAPVLAALFNTSGFLFYGVGVAKAIGSGMINLNIVTPQVVLAALLTAVVFNLFTWWQKFPTSSSHALLGSYAGAAIASASYGTAVAEGGWNKTILFMFLSPFVCIFLAFAFGLIVRAFLFACNISDYEEAQYSRWIQFVGAAGFSAAHGANDALKTAGIIAGLWFSMGLIKAFEVNLWLVIVAHITIGLGTWAKGKRLVDFVAHETTTEPTKSWQAAVATLVSWFSVHYAGTHSIPASSTLCAVPAMHGARASRNFWSVVWKKVWFNYLVWMGTLPTCAAFGWFTYKCFLWFHAV